ncbi:MAG: hypothetical protein R3C03_10250 [Pirellulaceae bacterium]
MSFKSKIDRVLFVAIATTSLTVANGCGTIRFSRYCKCDCQSGVARGQTLSECRPLENDYVGVGGISQLAPESLEHDNKRTSQMITSSSTHDEVDAKIQDSPKTNAPLAETQVSNVTVSDPEQIEAEPLTTVVATTEESQHVDSDRNVGNLADGWEVPQSEEKQELLAPVERIANADAAPAPVPSPAIRPTNSVENSEAESVVVVDQEDSDPSTAKAEDIVLQTIVPSDLAPLDQFPALNSNGIVLRAKIVQPLIRPLPLDVRQADGRRLNPAHPIKYQFPQNQNAPGGTSPMQLPTTKPDILKPIDLDTVPNAQSNRMIDGGIVLKATNEASEIVRPDSPSNEVQTANTAELNHK